MQAIQVTLPGTAATAPEESVRDRVGRHRRRDGVAGERRRVSSRRVRGAPGNRRPIRLHFTAKKDIADDDDGRSDDHQLQAEMTMTLLGRLCAGAWRCSPASARARAPSARNGRGTRHRRSQGVAPAGDADLAGRRRRRPRPRRADGAGARPVRRRRERAGRGAQPPRDVRRRGARRWHRSRGAAAGRGAVPSACRRA